MDVDKLKAGLKRSVGDRTSSVRHAYPTIECTESFIDSLSLRDRNLVCISPPKESEGYERGRSFVSEFFHDSAHSRRGSPPIYSFAPTYENGRLRMYASTPPGREKDIRDAVTGKYAGANIRPSDTVLPISAEDMVAGAAFHLNVDAAYSLQTLQTQDALDDDPQASFLSKLVGGTDETAMIQSVFQAIGGGWYDRGQVGAGGDRIAAALEEGVSVGHLSPEVITSDQMKNAAKDIQRQKGRDAFTVSLRVLAAAPDRETASRRVSDIASSLNTVKNPATQQRLVATPLGGRDLRAHLQSMAGRWLSKRGPSRYITGQSTVLTDEELGEGFVHLPAQSDVDVPIEWSEQTESERIPPDAF